MANYFRKFSECIENITAEEREWINSQLDTDRWEETDMPEWVQDLEGQLKFGWELESGLWIFSDSEEDGSGDLSQVTAFLSDFFGQFRPDESFVFNFALGCTSPVVGAFGSGAFVISRGGCEYMDGGRWALDRVRQLQGMDVPSNGLACDAEPNVANR